MPAKMFKEIAACVYGVVDIKIFHRPGRTGDKISGKGKYDRWPVIVFREPGSDNTDNPFVPFRIIDDRASCGFQAFILADHFNCLLRGQCIQVFSFRVVVVDLHSQTEGFFLILAYEQFNGIPAALNSSTTASVQ